VRAMPKQSDDLTREGDESQETKGGLKIPVPNRKQISSALRKAAQKQPDESERQAPPGSGKR
jgi:hypothetical protein